uniref:(California timema) hypothetical protein n=1 Tax=Timema californicum TaxID=61474 RepID=A0A7R9J982_TIMCA|nr:unnamed protein product [Timema californicum]
MNSVLCCAVCGTSERLLRCSRCRIVYYCSKEHQTEHWRRHKVSCGKSLIDKTKGFISEHGVNTTQNVEIANGKVSTSDASSPDTWDLQNKGGEASSWNTSPITYEGSSESEILNARTEILSPTLDFRNSASSNSPLNTQLIGMPCQGAECVMAPKSANGFKSFPEISLVGADSPPFLHKNSKYQQCILEEVCRNVIRDMDAYGLCVVDDFLGAEQGISVLNEVTGMYRTGVFKDGQLVSNKNTNDLKTIRGDQITWIDGKEKSCKNIGYLISIVDAIIMCANMMKDNGKMGDYTIKGRTKLTSHKLLHDPCHWSLLETYSHYRVAEIITGGDTSREAASTTSTPYEPSLGGLPQAHLGEPKFVRPCLVRPTWQVNRT